MSLSDYDVCVIGGGINGAGIARDAAGRGLSVLLVEKGDLAGATSGASTKLIHGGLRYLEYYDFKLVAESLKEREKLLKIAPHIIWPLEFILPHHSSLRPAWLIRIGLFLYDMLGGKHSLPKSKSVKLQNSPLTEKFTKGFSYSDCWAEDSRLVVLNAMDAAERGATIMTRTECSDIKAIDGHWDITLHDTNTNKVSSITAKTVVNATGPWVRGFMNVHGLSNETTPIVRQVKGSHIIVEKLYHGDECYILQQPDGRIVFTIPYEHHYTLIGTTEAPLEGDPGTVAISHTEIGYLCRAVNHHFQKQISAEDVISHYSGVRLLVDEGKKSNSATSRDYQLVMDTHDDANLLSVFGGKITTYRKLAEDVMHYIAPKTEDWTGSSDLPGGDIADDDFEAFVLQQEAAYPQIPTRIIRRYARAYGTRMSKLLIHGLGDHIGDDLYGGEVDYLMQYEWAQTADDILWRRSKLGLHVTPKTIENLKDWVANAHE